jgi:hypothetical protein
LHHNLLAQDKLNIKFGKVKSYDFEIKSPLDDSSPKSLVVADIVESSFVANLKGFAFSL